MNIILDTNVWVSGLLWGGIPGKILKLVKTGHIKIYISTSQLEELNDTLAKPKLQPKIIQLGVNPTTLMNAICAVSEEIVVPPITVKSLRDPDDAVILAAAVASNVDYIVSGDQDLLVLQEFSGIPILTPQAFLNQYFPTT
jgi:hypothetical protein